MKKKSKLITALIAVSLLFSGPMGCNCSKQIVNNSNEPVISESVSTGDISTSAFTSSEEERYVTRLRVINPPSSQFIEGRTYDLDDMVVVYVNGEIDETYPYTATVAEKSKDLAVLNGHELRIIGSGGDVDVLIEAGSKTARISGTAISALQYRYSQAIAEVSNRYSIYQAGYDDNDNFVMERWMLHNDGYCVIDGYDMSDDNHAGDNFVGGGLIKLRNGDTYWYNYSTNPDEIELFDRAEGDFYQYYIDMDYNLPEHVFHTTEWEDVFGEEFEALTVSRTDGTYDFDDPYSVFNTNLLDGLTFSDRKTYVPHTIYVYPKIDDTGHEFWVMDMELALETNPTVKVDNKYATFVFDFDEDNSCVPFIENYILEGELPETVPFTEIPAAFDALNAAKNYTLQTEVYICKPGEKDNETTAYDTETSFLTSDMCALTKITEDRYYSTFKGELYAAYYEKDGTIYQVTGDTSAAAGEGTLFETTLTTAGANSNAACFSEDSFRVMSRTPGAEATVFTANGADVKDFLHTLEHQDALGYRLIGQFDALSNNYGEDYYTILSITFSISADKIVVEAGMNWSDGYYSYVEFTYTNIGTTTVPELDSFFA